MTQELKEAVSKGAQLLDEKNPGWAAKINQDLLDMRSCTMCVLGQLYGEYIDGKHQIDISGQFGPDWGFYSLDNVDLKPLWLEEINQRIAPQEENNASNL